MKLRTDHTTAISRVAPRVLMCIGLVLFSRWGLAQIVRHADVERELRQAHYEQVFALSQRALIERPRDPQMRFWHALALDKLGQTQMALAEYQALTQEHPELPEPHNNLGVLLLKQGDIDAAQAAFQYALRMNSAYAEAMENLGDVLLLQARRLYENAIQAGPSRARLSQKINNLPPLPHKSP